MDIVKSESYQRVRQVQRPTKGSGEGRRCESVCDQITVRAMGDTIKIKCHKRFDHIDAHQAVTLYGEQDEKWWEWN